MKNQQVTDCIMFALEDEISKNFGKSSAKSYLNEVGPKLTKLLAATYVKAREPKFAEFKSFLVDEFLFTIFDKYNIEDPVTDHLKNIMSDRKVHFHLEIEKTDTGYLPIKTLRSPENGRIEKYNLLDIYKKRLEEQEQQI